MVSVGGRGPAGSVSNSEGPRRERVSFGDLSGLVGIALFGFMVATDSVAWAYVAFAGLLVAVPMTIGYGGRAWRLRAVGKSVTMTVAITVRLLALLAGIGGGLLVNALWPCAGSVCR